jgi:4'-phosphopantetheinyl transferase
MGDRTSLIPLTPAEIHVWLAFYDDIADERLHAAYRDLLAPAEKAQEPRFYFARDRRRYLVTRALVRTVLSRYVAIAPTEWVFVPNAYGRPDIANTQARHASLSFNISHTHSLIVLAITTRRTVGVDVENVRTRDAAIDVATHYFAPREVAALMTVPPHLQPYRFFEYWTFKEAYIKARGMGLSIPLDKFSFHYPDDRAVALTIDPDLADDPGRWQFWQLRPSSTSEYLVAICAERIGAQPTSLIVRRAVPMLSEEPWAVDLLRASAPSPFATHEQHDTGRTHAP